MRDILLYERVITLPDHFLKNRYRLVICQTVQRVVFKEWTGGEIQGFEHKREKQ